MQQVCDAQYPGVTIALPENPDNSHSWNSDVPKAGSVTITDATVVAVTARNGTATLVTNPTSNFVAVAGGGGSATVVVDHDGTGFMAFNGSNGGSVLTYGGSSGGSV